MSTRQATSDHLLRYLSQHFMPAFNAVVGEKDIDNMRFIDFSWIVIYNLC